MWVFVLLSLGDVSVYKVINVMLKASQNGPLPQMIENLLSVLYNSNVKVTVKFTKRARRRQKIVILHILPPLSLRLKAIVLHYLDHQALHHQQTCIL